MPSLTFTHKELVELLIRKAGLTEGIWGLQARFGTQATNIKGPDGELSPALVAVLLEIGLQKFEEVNNISVDAAELAKRDHERPKERKRS